MNPNKEKLIYNKTEEIKDILENIYNDAINECIFIVNFSFTNKDFARIKKLLIEEFEKLKH